MNELITLLYFIDFGWLGMAALIISVFLLLVAAFGCVVVEFMKSEEDRINEWRKLGEGK